MSWDSTTTRRNTTPSTSCIRTSRFSVRKTHQASSRAANMRPAWRNKPPTRATPTRLVGGPRTAMVGRRSPSARSLRVALSGPVSTTLANPPPSSGRVPVPRSGFWTCVDFRSRRFSFTRPTGAKTRTCSKSFPIGIGLAAKVRASASWRSRMPIRWSFSSMENPSAKSRSIPSTWWNGMSPTSPARCWRSAKSNGERSLESSSKRRVTPSHWNLCRTGTPYLAMDATPCR